MGEFVKKQTAAGYSFNLEAANHEPILTSEVYTSAAACLNGIDSVRANAPIAEIEDQTSADCVQKKNPKFELYKDKKGEFRFRLKARNGEPIGKSEGYSAKSGCLNGIESVRRNAPGSPVREE
jgi:uncharacterized protein YegP (UPF0339 family)